MDAAEVGRDVLGVCATDGAVGAAGVERTGCGLLLTASDSAAASRTHFRPCSIVPNPRLRREKENRAVRYREMKTCRAAGEKKVCGL